VDDEEIGGLVNLHSMMLCADMPVPCTANSDPPEEEAAQGVIESNTIGGKN